MKKLTLNKLSRLKAPALCLSTVVFFAACSDSQPTADNSSTNLTQEKEAVVEKTEPAVVVEETGEAMEETGDAIDDAADDTEDALTDDETPN